MTTFIIVQAGHTVFGIGESEEAAKKDAIQWLDYTGSDSDKLTELESDLSKYQNYSEALCHGGLWLDECSSYLAAKIQDGDNENFSHEGWDGFVHFDELED